MAGMQRLIALVVLFAVLNGEKRGGKETETTARQFRLGIVTYRLRRYVHTQPRVRISDRDRHRRWQRVG
jgi:hypothetical protein